MSTQPLDSVWVFNGTGARLPSAVFSSKEVASRWIEQHGLSGLLTSYPLDESMYDWAVRTGNFTPKRETHASAAFIQSFTSAARDHVHFENGKER